MNMRIAWFAWVARHFGEYGYGDGLLKGAVGTVVVLLTAGLVGYTLRRSRPAAVLSAGAVVALGVVWQATH
ncbi:hypothetical protein [Streptomyces sp. NBC_01294]|uniref:hypothetical protein n=1 Tax=Streptomyces sp. NBC_01294 TaxID=2903815 RepID=UPI002DD8DC82|nr:hypothetical protein [Streptomyces sp. NBC_01294]WRZ59228.1 hypothetical protein OG534_23740 [Streptomyces sp. NBC_01294]